jgi:hypothetical protein
MLPLEEKMLTGCDVPSKKLKGLSNRDFIKPAIAGLIFIIVV